MEQQLKEKIHDFINALIDHTGNNLISAFLYGGYAKNDFTKKKSNVNILLILEYVNMETLDAISVTIQKAIADFKLSPFILTSSEVVPSSDVFAVKLFDIQKHHLLLYGKDVITPLEFNHNYLQFISEQELRNQLSRMKFFYIQHFNFPDALLNKLQSGITTLLVNANTYLFLKYGIYLETREEITQRILLEKQMNKESLLMLLSLRNPPNTIHPNQIKQGYDLLMLEYKHLLKEFKVVFND
jgi:hypothetical protein